MPGSSEILLLDTEFPSQHSSVEVTDKQLSEKAKESSIIDYATPPKPHSNPNLTSKLKSTLNAYNQNDDEELGSKVINANPKEGSSRDTADIKEVKSSLKEHYDAIKSLQNALSNQSPTKQVFPSRPVIVNRTNDQTSKAIKERIRMIETTLKEVGENVSISENISDPICRESSTHSSRQRPPTPSYHSQSQQDGIGKISKKSVPSSKAIPKSGWTKSQSLLPSVIDRLEKMEISIAKLATNFSEIQIQKRDKRAMEDLTENSSMAKLVSEVHKLRHDFKAQEIVNQEIIKKNEYLEKQLKLMADPAAMVLKNGQIDPRVENYCKKLVTGVKSDILADMRSKVDTAVLEELALHIATKEELKCYVKKEKLGKLLAQYQNERLPGLNNENSNEVGAFANYERRTDETISKIVKAIEKLEEKISNIHSASQNYVENTMGSLQQTVDLKLQNFILEKSMAKKTEWEELLRSKLDALKKDIDRGVKEMISTSMQHIFDENTYFPNNEEETNPLIKKLVRDFDEKIYTICSDLSSCKQLFVNQSTQPFYRCAQWIWTSGQLKLGSAVPWNLQTTNTDPDNFRWTQDHFNIKIADAGLYEINFAFFTKSKPSIQIVVNGESVLSAINSPSFVVQHSSGFVTDGNGKVEQGTITGISLVDFLALPSKSTLSIHYHGVSKNIPSHGFLGLKRL